MNDGAQTPGDNGTLAAVALDQEGFLRDLADWTPELAALLARAEGIDLSTRHWEILEIARDYYARFGISASMRVLVGQVKKQLGADKGRSLHLMLLFPDRPARKISRIAGLPKPLNCD
jgi:tRNA 2-thiouridine synthesizing protein E